MVLEQDAAMVMLGVAIMLLGIVIFVGTTVIVLSLPIEV